MGRSQKPHTSASAIHRKHHRRRPAKFLRGGLPQDGYGVRQSAKNVQRVVYEWNFSSGHRRVAIPGIQSRSYHLSDKQSCFQWKSWAKISCKMSRLDLLEIWLIRLHKLVICPVWISNFCGLFTDFPTDFDFFRICYVQSLLLGNYLITLESLSKVFDEIRTMKWN